MSEVTIIGIDLAKRVFQLHGARQDGSVVFRKKLSRGQVLAFVASGSVRGRGGNLGRVCGVTGVAIEEVGLWWSCELQPRTEETPDDRDQHALDRAAAKA